MSTEELFIIAERYSVLYKYDIQAYEVGEYLQTWKRVCAVKMKKQATKQVQHPSFGKSIYVLKRGLEGYLYIRR